MARFSACLPFSDVKLAAYVSLAFYTKFLLFFKSNVCHEIAKYFGVFVVLYFQNIFYVTCRLRFGATLGYLFCNILLPSDFITTLTCIFRHRSDMLQKIILYILFCLVSDNSYVMRSPIKTTYFVIHFLNVLYPHYMIPNTSFATISNFPWRSHNSHVLLMFVYPYSIYDRHHTC